MANLSSELESGLRAPPAGPPRLPSAPGLRGSGRGSDRGNPTGETSRRDVTLLGDVTGPPGESGVPTEKAFPGLRRARAGAGKSLGAAARLHCAPCLPHRSRAAPGEARPRARRRHGKERAPLLSPAGARTT